MKQNNKKRLKMKIKLQICDYTTNTQTVSQTFVMFALEAKMNKTKQDERMDVHH